MPVPLGGKREWAVVKTLAEGAIAATSSGPSAVDLSYFSRRADHVTFTRLATVETHRRGLETAGAGCGVTRAHHRHAQPRAHACVAHS